MVDTRPIGIFDSGIGGLTVLKQLQRALPHEHFVYFADTANLPYGEKTPAQIIDYARHTLTWMQDEVGAKLVVAACHTSSATALDLVSNDYTIPVIGTIYPMVETILKNHADARIGIIATPTSVASRMHENILRKSGFQGDIVSISCPRFVPLIEAGHIFGPELLRFTNEYLAEFKNKDLNTLIYGCTHYPWISDTIRHVLPDAVDYIDPADHIATKVAQELYKYKLLNNSENKGSVDFHTSAAPETLSSQVSLLMSVPKPLVTLNNLTATASPNKLVVNQ
ncbi:MAG: glutamate racemase [Alphaproteobacteria bacterium]|jgi:glutamate racemase|nr:glutamate racemase [Alphaproteobacteria bacterium]